MSDHNETRGTMTQDEIAAKLKEFAVQRFDEHGPGDARGAALWDASEWLREEAESR